VFFPDNFLLLVVGEEAAEEAAEGEEEEEAGLVAWVIVVGEVGWRRVKEGDEGEEKEEAGKRKPGGGSDVCDGGGRRVVAKVTSRRTRRRQGRRRTTGRKGKERDARPLLILVLRGKGGDNAANAEAGQGMVMSWCVGGGGTMHTGNGNRARGCSIPALSSLQAPAAAGAAGLLLLIRSTGLLSSISMGVERWWQWCGRTRGEGTRVRRRSNTSDEVMMTLSEPGAFGLSLCRALCTR
jgi:hypothetical protein